MVTATHFSVGGGFGQEWMLEKCVTATIFLAGDAMTEPMHF